MGFYPKNPAMGQIIQSDVPAVNPDESFIAHLIWTALECAAAAADAVHAAIVTSVAITTVEIGFVNPPCARNITATAGGGNDINIKAVSPVIYGTNMADEAITEALPAFTVDTAGLVAGSKAFKTVNKIVIPAMDGAGVTVTVGFADKLGMPYKLPYNTVLKGSKAAVVEGTAPTVAVSPTVLESNTIDFNSALDGTLMHAHVIV